MKKYFSLLIAVFILASAALTSCSLSSHLDRTYNDAARLKIVTTIFPPYDFARAVAGGEEAVQIQMLLPPGSESHDYEPSLADIAAIANCDIFICVGGETDKWVEDVLDITGEDMTVLRLTSMVELCEEEEVNGDISHRHSHTEHSHSYAESNDIEYDEHVWTTPENAAALTDAICESMCSCTPELAESFKKSADKYINELLSLDAEYEQLSKEAENKTLIFADRFPFRYLAEKMLLDCYAAFSGCSSDSEPSLATIGYLTSVACETKAHVILTVEFGNTAAAKVIANECGAAVRTLHSCHNVSREDFDSGVTCLDIMRENLKILREALLYEQ